MPEPLWVAAVQLARKHGVNPVARALRLDYYSLKRRVVGQEREDSPTNTLRPPRFVEVDLSGAFAGTGCVVVMEHPSGAKMTLRISGSEGLDLAALTRSFWSQES